MSASKALPHARWWWRAAALAALGLVFVSYLQPDLMLQLALQVWSCF
jgi:hypothetical protein